MKSPFLFMSRSTSYISKPSQDWLENYEKLSNTTLFLMARSGPSVFKIRDEQDVTYKVTLGNPHSCSCKTNPGVSCIHIIYCVIKVLRVSKEHPLCYQNSLTDQELNQVLSGQCSLSSRTRQVPQRPARKEPGSPEKNENVAGQVPRQPLLDDQEENNCPICQDNMEADEPLTWCRHGCGNNMHARCMMKYATHKISSKLDPVCPLCRELWDMAKLKLDCREKSSAIPQSVLPVRCSRCKTTIRRLFHRCIECSQIAYYKHDKPIDYCLECFNHLSSVHQSHHFLTSDASIENALDVTWSPCSNILSSDQPIHNIFRDLQTRELNVNDYDLLLSLDRKDPNDVATNLLAALPKYHPDTISSQSSFCWCSEPNNVEGLVYLPCKHQAHSNCIREDLNLLIMEDMSKIAEYRCSHDNCGKCIFVSLKRKKRSIQKDKDKDLKNLSTQSKSKITQQLIQSISDNASSFILPSIIGRKVSTQQEGIPIHSNRPSAPRIRFNEDLPPGIASVEFHSSILGASSHHVPPVQSSNIGININEENLPRIRTKAAGVLKRPPVAFGKLRSLSLRDAEIKEAITLTNLQINSSNHPMLPMPNVNNTPLSLNLLSSNDRLTRGGGIVIRQNNRLSSRNSERRENPPQLGNLDSLLSSIPIR